MQKINVSKFLFISSNILYFFTILLTYLDLSKFNLSDVVNPTQFSLITYVVIIFFLVNIVLLYNHASVDKFEIFNIFFYYLILSSGVYVVNFPLMDELILITSASYFLTQLIMSKRIIYNSSSNYIMLILFILFLQSIIGLFHDIRSIRYIFIFLSLIICFLYFLNLQEINDKKHKIFLNYLFYGIIIYIFYQFFFWYLKFYVFEMKFVGQKFIGDMQPSYAKSSSGHFDAIHILSGYLILFFTIKSDSFIKKLILFFSIFAFWILADARSSMFLLFSIISFYFIIIGNSKKIIFISLTILILIQTSLFNFTENKYISRAQNTIEDIVNIKIGAEVKKPVYKLESGAFYYTEEVRASYGDFGRLSYFLTAINSIKYNPFIFVGCGFYAYYYCSEEAQIEVHDKFDVPIAENLRGFGNKQVRPPAAGTIIVENGLLIILMSLFYYMKFLKKNIYIVNGKLLIKTKLIIISIYLFSTIIIWSLFSNILDIIFVYLFLMPIFRKYVFYKI